jgi:hypothetical protein
VWHHIILACEKRTKTIISIYKVCDAKRFHYSNSNKIMYCITWPIATFLEASSKSRFCLCRLFGFPSREHEHLHIVSGGSYLLAIAFVSYCSFVYVYVFVCMDRIIWSESYHPSMYCLRSLTVYLRYKGRTIFTSDNFVALKLATYKHCLEYCTLTQISNRFPCQRSIC